MDTAGQGSAHGTYMEPIEQVRFRPLAGPSFKPLVLWDILVDALGLEPRTR